MAKILNTEFEKFTNGFAVGGENIGIEAAKITSATVGVTNTWPTDIATAGGLIPTVSAVDSEIKAKIGTVYKVKETINATVDENGFINNMPENPENGDVHNIALSGISSAKIGTAEKYETVTNGDNVVYIVTGEGETATGAWDKLAGAVDTETFATKDWVNSDDNDLYDYVMNQSISAANSLSAIAADPASEERNKLVQAGAVTDYIYDQIQSTIQETIDVTNVINDTVALSAIPNVQAVSGYVDEKLENTFAYGQIIVNTASAAADTPFDAFKMENGNGITLETVQDADQNPTIKFNTNIQITGKNGSADDALTFTAVSAVSEGQSQFDITIPDATTAAAGVTKAAYYSDPEEDGDGLIHLF